MTTQKRSVVLKLCGKIEINYMRMRCILIFALPIVIKYFKAVDIQHTDDSFLPMILHCTLDFNGAVYLADDPSEETFIHGLYKETFVFICEWL